MSTSVNETYYLKMNSGQVIGPLRMLAIEAMLRSNKIDDTVEVSTDQRVWVRLSLLLDPPQDGDIPLADVIPDGAEPLWDFGSVNDAAEDPVMMSEPVMEELTYLPGKPAPMPGRSVSDFVSPDHLNLDVPLPGLSRGPQQMHAPLPARAGSHPTNPDPVGRGPAPYDPLLQPLQPPPNSKFADIPMPGVSAPLPGVSAPLPGRGAPLPGKETALPGAHAPLPGPSNPLPGLATPHSGSNPYVETNVNIDSNVPLDFPPKILDQGFKRDADFGSERGKQFGGHQGPFSPVGGHDGPASLLNGAGRDPAKHDAYDLGYEVDDLFAAGGEKNSLFSASPSSHAETHGSQGTYGSHGSQVTGGKDEGDVTFSGGLKYDVGPVDRPQTLMGTPSLAAQVNQWEQENKPAKTFGATKPFGLDSTVDALPEFELEDSVDQNLVYSKYTDPDNVAEFSSSSALGLPAHTSSMASEVEPIKPAKKSSKLTLILLVILVVVCVGAGTYFYLETRTTAPPPTTPIARNDTPAAPTPPPVNQGEIKDDKLKEVVSGGKDANALSLNAIAFDNYRDYARLSSNSEKQKAAALSLLVKSIIRSRYPGTVDEDGTGKVAAQFASASGGLEALARGAWDASGGAADAARSYFEQVEDSNPTQDYYVYALSGVGDVVALRDYLQTSPDEIDESRIEGYATTARRALNQAVKKDPNLPFAYFWLGQLAELLGDPKVAIENYKKAVDAQGYHAGAFARLGKAYVYSGQLKEAKGYAEKLIQDLEPVAHPSELSTAYEVLGDVEFLNNHWKEAIASLKKAVEVDPNNESALMSLADVFEFTDNAQDAINFFTVAPFLKRDQAAVMLVTARAEIAIGRINDAKTLLLQGEKQFPNDVNFPLALGWLYESESNFTGAQAAYKRALDRNPRLSAAQVALARITWRSAADSPRANAILETKDPADPTEIPYRVAYNKGVYYLDTNQIEKAKGEFLKALQLAPGYISARRLLIDALVAEGKYDQAQVALTNAENSESNVALQLAKAKILIASKEVDAAKAIVNRILEADESNSEALVLLAQIATKEGDYEVAEKALKDATKSAGDVYIDKSIAKGLLSLAKQDYEQAKISFETLLRLRPNARAANYYLGDVYNALGNRAKAQEMYGKYIQAPGYRVPLALVYLKRGDLFFQNGIYKMAESDYEEALKSSLITPEQRCQALTGISNVAMKQKKFRRAIEYLQLALETGAQLAETHLSLGKAYANAGDSASAVRELTQAKELGLQDPEIDRLRAYALKEQGRSEAAREAFTQYLKTLNPAKQSAEIKEILRQIDTL